MSIIQALMAIPSSTELGPFSVRYLVIAGGGGGAGDLAGGGGAGGYLASSTTVTGGVNYTVTVGGGGAGGGAVRQSTTQDNTNGSPSTFFNFTASGGGKGGSYWADSDSSKSLGKNGGSGGGAGAGASISYSGGVAVSGQGNDGGNGGFATNYPGGGGGGAGAAGTNVSGQVSGGAGGNGLSSDITGTSITRAGGGGGGTYDAVSATAAPGGTGGGGAGWGNTSNAVAGTANTGGGGGGGGYDSAPSSSPTAGAAGGAGVVILSYPNTVILSNPGGGLTFSSTENGSNTVTTFTAGTGNIRFDGVSPLATIGHSLPMSGGTQWFSQGYLGVENTTGYKFLNNIDYSSATIYYRRVQSGSYRWWFLLMEDLGSNQYKQIYGAKIELPAGGSTGDVVNHTFSDAAVISTFGSLVIPSTGNFYIGWHSGVTGDSPPGNPIFVDASTGGGIDYLLSTSTTPSLNTTWTASDTNTGNKIHIAVVL